MSLEILLQKIIIYRASFKKGPETMGKHDFRDSSLLKIVTPLMFALQLVFAITFSCVFPTMNVLGVVPQWSNLA